MNDQTKRLLGWGLVVIAIIVAGFLGVSYPIPEPPQDQVVQLGTTNFDDLVLSGDLTVGDDADVAGSLTVGTSSLYPLGHASDGLQAVYATTGITGTAQLAHGLTTVDWALCTMAEAPTAGVGDGAYCGVISASNIVTATVYQDDFVTAATEADVAVNWLVIGTP